MTLDTIASIEDQARSAGDVLVMPPAVVLELCREARAHIRGEALLDRRLQQLAGDRDDSMPGLDDVTICEEG